MWVIKCADSLGWVCTLLLKHPDVDWHESESQGGNTINHSRQGGAEHRDEKTSEFNTV